MRKKAGNRSIKMRKKAGNRSIKMRKTVGKHSSDRYLDSKHEIIDPRDTISRLPDSVLRHMISFLPSSDKDQVHTLSRNWRRINADTRKKLSLIGRRLDEQELSRILDDVCPSVESLSLRKCFGLTTLSLVKLKLKAVELHYCGSLKTLLLNTPNLETFLFSGPRLRPCTIEFGLCKQLRTIHLVGVAMNNMMFIDCNNSFPILRELILSCCDMTGGIKISSDSLEWLFLLRVNMSVDISIEAPNLLYFVFNGSKIPLLSMNLSRLTSATVELNPSPCRKPDELWFLRLFHMLVGLRHIERLMFHSNDEKNIVFPKELRETLRPPFGRVLSIEVKTNSSSSKIVDLLDAMLWMSPRVRNIVFSSNNWMFELKLCHWEFSRDSCSFCSSYPSSYWRHSLVEYSLKQTYDEFQFEPSYYLLGNLQKVGRHATSSTAFVKSKSFRRS